MRYPCNSRYAGGLVHVAFKDMARDADEIHAAIEARTGGLTDPDLTRMLAEYSPRAIEWMRGQGAKFIKAGPQERKRWVLAPPRPRTPGLEWRGRGPDVPLRALTAGALGGLGPARTDAGGTARPILKPPFQAVLACAGLTYPFGGIAIDRDARVLAKNDDPVPGLYAAGSCTGGAEGGPRAAYIGGLSKAVITGLRAAEHIAEAKAGG